MSAKVENNKENLQEITEEISLDGGPNLSSKEIKDWLENWGVTIRPSSAYYPQSNGRAEAAVKTLKRLLQRNTGSRGSTDTDSIAKALLQHRNTPLRDVGRSPAQLALGRDLRDTIPLPKERYKVDLNWAHHLRERERKMFQKILELSIKSSTNKSLRALMKGSKVLCQNARTRQWDRSGTIVETHPFRKYSVKMDGSGRVSLRNRRHLQCIDANKSSGLPLTSNKPSTKTNDTPDLPSNRNLTQDGTTTGIPETTTDKEANK